MNKRAESCWGVLTILLATSINGWAGAGTGTTAVPFLTMGAGARALAMGEAATATVDDATALYWNPGGLTRLTGQSATFMHAASVEDSAYDYAGYGRGDGTRAWGVGLQYFSAGEVEETDQAGAKTGSMRPNDAALTGGYARKIGEYGVGLSAKYVQSTLVETARTLALDGGVLSPTIWKDRLRGGVSVSNVGGKITYDQESAPLPMTIRGGIEVRPWKGWTGAFDVVAPKGDDLYFALGGECRLGLGRELSLSLRGGYTTRASSGGQAEGLSAGLGFGWNRLTVDYAFVSHGDLDPSQVLSVGYGF
jgi:hypothetical protein